MTTDEHYLRGVNARAANLSKFDCPFYKAEAIPEATGETMEQWQAKVDAWERGWSIEDAIRGGQS